MWRLLLKNLLRNKRRNLLTAASVAVSLFLLASLAMVYTALGQPSTRSRPRLLVRRASGVTTPLPRSYAARIRSVPGVAALTAMTWFGGYWVDPANKFANFAMDADAVFEVVPTAMLPPDQLAAFKREQTAAVAGRQLAEKYHWKVGDRITLLGSPWTSNPAELTLRGIFTGGPEDQFYFHWDYFNELTRRRNMTQLYWLRLERPEDAPRVVSAIDDMFRNSDAETRTESESSFLLEQAATLGNARLLILIVGGAAGFAILLIVANTMAMSIRERVVEAAVMRVVGFHSAQILALFLGESLSLTLAGALVGVGVAKALYDHLAMKQIGPMVWADIRLRPETLVFCTALAVLLALFASGLPALRVARINLARALRYVG